MWPKPTDAISENAVNTADLFGVLISNKKCFNINKTKF